MYEQKHDYVAIKAKYKRWRDGQFGNDVEFMKQENLAHGTFKKILSDWKEDFAKEANDAQVKTLEGVDWRRESRELDEQRQAEKEKLKENAETDIASGDIGKLAKKKVIELMNGDKEQTALRAAIEVLDMEGQRKKGGLGTHHLGSLPKFTREG